MKCFRPQKRIKGSMIIILITVLCNSMIFVTSIFINDYVLNVFLRTFLVIFNIYQLYYILQFATLNYQFENEMLTISSIFGLKRIKIPYIDLEKYTKTTGNLDAIKLSGYGGRSFAIGRCFFYKFGAVNMNVTHNENIFFIKTKEDVYAVSPINVTEFENELRLIGIEDGNWSLTNKITERLYKDNYFRIPFFLVSILIIIFIARPLYLYYGNMLPQKMPLSFNVKFEPTIMGTSKDFVLKQLEYGLLNMALVFCMYYAAHLNAKHYRKSAYKYIYFSLAVVIVFLIIQQKVLWSLR